MYKKIVQRGTENEFPLRYTLEGDLNSKNLMVMIHGGGMDHHEKGFYTTFDENGKPVKKMINGKMKTVLNEQHIGNYDRMVGELEAIEADTLIVRVDLRNHGESLLPDGTMDERDTSVLRFAGDILDLIHQIEEEREIENIDLVGTCIGGLIAECIATGTTTCNHEDTVEKIRSLFLNCPLSFHALTSTDPTDTFNYNKNKEILAGKRFTKMKGMFEGKETFLEGLYHLDMPELVASVPNLKIFYLFGADDRLLKQEKSTAILKEMLKVNPNIEYYKMTQENSHGYPDHCLWSPQCSDLFLRIAMNFYHNVITKQDNYTQVRKK